MIKSERGITILVLIISIAIMLILVGTGIRYGGESLEDIRLQNFSYELQQIQGRVDSFHEKMKTISDIDYINFNGQEMGINVTSSTKAVETLKRFGINYDIVSEQDKNLYYEGNGVDTYYRYFSKANLEKQLDIKNAKINVIINFKTREVISVEPQIYKENKYYRLQDLKQNNEN